MPVYPGAFSVFIGGEYSNACQSEYSQLWASSRRESCLANRDTPLFMLEGKARADQQPAVPRTGKMFLTKCAS
jgi:hypothetical protein